MKSSSLAELPLFKIQDDVQYREDQDRCEENADASTDNE